MKLKDVLRKVKPLETIGSMETEITDVQIDSRKVKKGSLFIAERGTQTDGHVFIPAAVKNGAAAVVCETMPEEIDGNTVFVRLESTEAAAGPIATQFYGDPSRKLKLVGVTGTNGKTTIATLLYNMFRKFGYKCGLCSTVCNYIDEEAVPADHTTPDPATLNYLLGRMADAGCQYAFMEVSSHSIAQKRIGGLVFAGGIFTNLTRDHLDYHKTFENYRDAKKAFFDGLPKTAFAITNGDDKNGMIMVQNTAATVKTYSTRSMADFRARILEMSFEGMLLEIDGREVSVPFVGKFNVSNLLAVYGAARMLGREAMEILTTLSTLHSVAGRFETLRSPSGYTAIVDYAHTPDALVNVLSAIHEVLKESRSLESKVITVCGAGGNRGFSAMMLVERHRSGIAKVCDVRKHGIRLAVLSTFFLRARLGCAAQATLYPPLYITNPQKRSPKRTFRGSLLCMGDGSAITQCPEPSWRWRPSGSRQRWRRASCCPAGRTRRRRRSRP